MNAVLELECLGYKLCLRDDCIQYEFSGPVRPDPTQVSALLANLRERKAEAMTYLKLRNSAATSGPQAGRVCVVGDETTWLQLWATPEAESKFRQQHQQTMQED